MKEFTLDYERPARIGFGEAIFCAGKTPAQIDAIVAEAAGTTPLLMTRLDPQGHAQLTMRDRLDYDPLSRTAFLGTPPPPQNENACIVILTAGTSDLPVAREALRMLQFNGQAPLMISDVGVAGLWRLLQRIEEIRRFPIVIVAAGMDAALPTVIGGLVPGSVIAVPTSVGYGVAAGGHSALNAMLASCAPGIVVVNIDNGYGGGVRGASFGKAIADRAIARQERKRFFFEKKNQKTFSFSRGQ